MVVVRRVGDTAAAVEHEREVDVHQLSLIIGPLTETVPPPFTSSDAPA